MHNSIIATLESDSFALFFVHSFTYLSPLISFSVCIDYLVQIYRQVITSTT